MATRKTSTSAASTVDTSDLEKKLNELESRFNDLLSRLQETPGIKSRVSDV